MYQFNQGVSFVLANGISKFKYAARKSSITRMSAPFLQCLSNSLSVTSIGETSSHAVLDNCQFAFAEIEKANGPYLVEIPWDLRRSTKSKCTFGVNNMDTERKKGYQPAACTTLLGMGLKTESQPPLKYLPISRPENMALESKH
jgi:hypothetical protein